MKKEKVTFEEMTQIHEDWFNHDKKGPQEDVFKRNGWSRNSYFNESYYREHPEERPEPKKNKM